MKDKRRREWKRVFDPSLPPSAYTSDNLDELILKSPHDATSLCETLQSLLDRIGSMTDTDKIERKKLYILQMKQAKHDFLTRESSV